MSFLIISSGCGSLLAYIIGEGEALSALLGGNSFFWSIFFWSVGSFLIWRGLQTVKTVEKILSIIVITLISFLSFYLLKDFNASSLVYHDTAKILLPFGVILFALNASPAIVEAHAVLPGNQKKFKKAVIIGTLIPIIVYILFALAVVGATGLSTTQVASVGLGEKLGDGVWLFSNLFAVLAMGTAFMGMGMALKQTLTWDFKLPKWSADALVMIAPLFLFTAGLRSFILILEVVGGAFIGAEAIMLVLACYKARRKAKTQARLYHLHNFWLLAVPVFALFTFTIVYSIVKMFI